MSSVLWNKKRASTLFKKLGWQAEAAVLRLFWWTMRRLPPERASAAGDWLLRRLGSRSDKFRKVRANLAMAFPEKDAGEIEQLAHGVMGNLGAVLAEFAYLQRLIDRQDPDPRLEIVNLNEDPAFVEGSKPCIFFSGHLANWELVAFAAEAIGHPSDGLYTPLSNPLLDRLLQDKRRQLGSTHVPRDKALRHLLKSLRRGRSVGMLVDVRIDDTNLLPFFGTGAGLAVGEDRPRPRADVLRAHGPRTLPDDHLPGVAATTGRPARDRCRSLARPGDDPCAGGAHPRAPGPVDVHQPALAEAGHARPRGLLGPVQDGRCTDSGRVISMDTGR